jgi:hypothetical protein
MSIGDLEYHGAAANLNVHTHSFGRTLKWRDWSSRRGIFERRVQSTLQTRVRAYFTDATGDTR